MNLKERNENMREFFNRKVDTYDQVHSAFMNTKNQMIESIDYVPRKVLDLGAGTGLELISLFERFPEVSIVATDISENMLNELKKRPFSNRVTTMCGDFFEVEFGGDFDTVISTSALHHFLYEDKKELYKKVFDSMKAGGVFLNSDKIALDQKEEDSQAKTYEQYKNEIPHIDTPLTIEHEMSILKEVGFVDIEVIETNQENYRLFKAFKR